MKEENKVILNGEEEGNEGQEEGSPNEKGSETNLQEGSKASVPKEKGKDGVRNFKKEKEVEPTQEERLEDYSQKIFGKPTKDIKYVLVTNYIHQQLLEEELARTGLYQWVNVFKGEIKRPRDVVDYNEYDIVHVNMSTQDIPEVANIREQLKEGGKTKLVVNNDYTTEMWSKSFNSVETIRREIEDADMVFGTEYFQVTALAEVTNRKVFIIPHPADVKRLKNLPKKQVKNIISTLWRRYDNHAFIPSLAVRNHGLTTQLIGYDKALDPKTWLTTTQFDYVFAGTNFFDFCDQMRESAVVYDPFTYHSYNRAVVDCAAMGVPVVGSSRTQSVNVCYPYTKVDPYDINEARKLIERLLTDEKFKKKVIDHAQEVVEYYNHSNSKEKYLMALEEALREDRRPITRKKRPSDKGTGDDVNKVIADEKTRKTNK